MRVRIDEFYIHIMQYVDFMRAPAHMRTAARIHVLLLRRMIHDAVDDRPRFSEGRIQQTDDDTQMGMLPFANMARLCALVYLCGDQ